MRSLFTWIMLSDGIACCINLNKLYIPAIVALCDSDAAVLCAWILVVCAHWQCAVLDLLYIWSQGISWLLWWLAEVQKPRHCDSVLPSMGVFHGGRNCITFLEFLINWGASPLCFELSGKLFWSHFQPENIIKNLRKILVCSSYNGSIAKAL